MRHLGPDPGRAATAPSSYHSGGLDIRRNRANVCAANSGGMMTATSPEGSIEAAREPVKPGRRPDWRVVLIVGVFLPLMLGLPYLWPRVIDPVVPPPRIERRDDVTAALAAAATLPASYAE